VNRVGNRNAPLPEIFFGKPEMAPNIFSSRYMGANENFVPVVVKSGGAPCLAF
jgi:hypothetical protein